jgi:hypothetical protein
MPFLSERSLPQLIMIGIPGSAISVLQSWLSHAVPFGIVYSMFTTLPDSTGPLRRNEIRGVQLQRSGSISAFGFG